MASNKSCRGTGNLLQDLLSSVVRLKKCDKQIIATNTVKSELKIKSQFIHCFICGVKHERRPLSKVKVEILQEIILKESFHGSVSPTSICPLCSTTLDKLIDLRKKVDDISTCIRSLMKLCHSLSDLEDIEIQEASSEIIDNDNISSGVKSCGAEIQNSTTEIIYNVTLNDENKDSSVGLSNAKSDDDDVDSEDEIIVPDFDDVIVSINSKSSPNLETLTCLECNVTFDKSWKLNRHHRNPWLGRSERQNDRTNFTDNETNLQDFEEPDCLNVSKTVDNTSNEDVKKCESDISDYDCVPIDDLILEVVEESIKGSEDDQAVGLDVNLDGVSDLISNYDGNFILDLSPELPLALPEIEDLVVHLDDGNEPINVIVDTLALPLEKIDGEDDDGVNIEEFVQCKAEDESEELASICDPARDVAIVPFFTEPSGGLQIAKVKNEDGEEVKLFTNPDGVYEILPDFDSYPSIIPTTASPTLGNLTCLECKVSFNKSWKLSRHQRNPWLDRSPQQNKKRSRLISNHDKEADLQNDAKRPRLLRIRREKLIKNITNRDKLNNDDFDDSDDVLASISSTSNEIKSPSDDESIYGEDVEISKKSGRYKCLKCNTTYGSMYNLGRHLKTTIAHTGRNPPPDPRTGIVTHDELASLKCTVCAATFDDAETLTKHKSTHDKKCDICDHKFLHTKDLHRHLKTQKHAVALKCLKLNEGGVATFSCDQCDHVGFPDLSGLLQHRQKIHVQMLSYGPTEEEIATLRCTICSEKFDDLATLEKHKALHGNKCDVCNLKCRDPSGLNRHLQTNAHQSAIRSRRVDSEGKVTFVCDQCPEVEPFPDPPKLIMHMKKFHQRILMLAKGKITSLKCTICSKKFDNKAALTNHKSSHGKKCDICDIEFSNEIELREHLESQKHAVSLSCRRLNDDSVDTYDQVEFPDLVDTIRGGSEGRSISKDETEADLQNHVKRPRLSRIRAEKLIKNLTNRVNLNNDENDDREDSDFNASSDNSTSTEVESSSDEESIYGEDKNNLSRPELNFDDTEICAESGRYKCLRCNTAYGSMYHLTRHLSTTFAHTGRIPSRHARPLVPTQNEIATLKCTICDWTFDDVETLTEHKSTHWKKCEICNIEFADRKQLRKHLETKKHCVTLKYRRLNEDGVATFSCDKCDQVGFPDLSKLLQHMDKIHKSRPELNFDDAEVSKKSGRYKCLKCNTSYVSKNHLRRHLATTSAHTGRPTPNAALPTQDEIASLKCTVCAEKFDDVATLTMHKNKYRKKCEICDLSFPHGQALRKHLKSQNHATALSCRKVNDDGVVTFSCDKCDQVEFPDLLRLLKHKKLVHAAILSRGTAGDDFDVSTIVKTNTRNTMRCEVCERNLVLRSSNSAKQHLQSRNHQLARVARRVDSDGKVSFVCDRCPVVEPFPNYQKLVDHRKKYHPGRSVFNDGSTAVKSCVPCDKVFYTTRAYKIHLYSMRHADTIGTKETVSLDFACNLCDRKYAANFQLRAHLASVHFEAVVCEMCGTRCRDLAGLTAHQKKHVEPPKMRKRSYIPPEDRRYPCKFCGKRFLYTYDRSRHVNVVHKGKRYKCDLCQKTFPSSSGLSSHKKYVHNLVKGVLQPAKLSSKSQPIKCNICLKSVSKEIGASHIELVHFQDKSKCPYDCCPDLEFETEQEWIQHLEGCTSEKITEASQSPCLVCDAVFRNQLLRLSHHHQTHETFPCEICSKLFSKQTTLNTHKYSHPESKPHLCSKCGQRFRQPRNLRLHLTTVCGDDDEARKKLQAKRRASDISSRDKKKNFNCNECSMGFITSRRFELHKEKVHGGQDDGGNGKSDTEDSDTDA